MKLLLENWREYLKEQKLRVFDFDDTLAKTDARIVVNKADGSILDLTPGEYAVYEPEEDDEFDYSEFRGELINPREVKAVTNIFRRVIAAGTEDRKVAILTARAPDAYGAIRDYLVEIGVDPDDVEFAMLGTSEPEAKSSWIEDHIKKGYNDIYFVDDSGKNVAAVNNLKKSYPDVKIRAQKVEY